MKKLFLALAFASLCAARLQATPYFHFLHIEDTSTYRANLGSYIDPTGKSSPEHGGEVATIYHSKADGYLFLKGEDWSLLSLGGVVNGQLQSKIAIGPQFNVLPIMGYLGSYAIGLISPTGSFKNLRATLEPTLTAPSGPDLSISVGPKFLYDPNGNKGYFRIFIGGVLNF